MKVRTTVGLLVVGLVAAGPPAVRGFDVGSAFTYQGELLDEGVPVNGITEFEFSLWDDPVAGTLQVALAPVPIGHIGCISEQPAVNPLTLSNHKAGEINGPHNYA